MEISLFMLKYYSPHPSTAHASLTIKNIEYGINHKRDPVHDVATQTTPHGTLTNVGHTQMNRMCVQYTIHVREACIPVAFHDVYW